MELKMEIKRINTYNDSRFSTHVLMQHGCFLIDDEPYEVEIISNYEAIVKGDNRDYYLPLIEEFRFYTPHITKFYDDDKNIIIEYPKENIIEIELKNIQPSQFYVDRKKLSMIQEFIHEEKDIIIQAMPYQDRYIALDGHTRLFLATLLGFHKVYACMSTVDESIYDFVNEAKRRKIYSPYDLIPLSHEEYETLWNSYCDAYFSSK